MLGFYLVSVDIWQCTRALRVCELSPAARVWCVRSRAQRHAGHLSRTQASLSWTWGQLNWKYAFRCNTLCLCAHAVTIKLNSRGLVYVWYIIWVRQFQRLFWERLKYVCQQANSKLKQKHKPADNNFRADLNVWISNRIFWEQMEKSCCALKPDDSSWNSLNSEEE